MACFIVPTIVGIGAHSQRKRFPAWAHINWLTAMVLGGAVGLAVEHYAHGEIVPWPPFLTAMATPAQTSVMLNEMAAIGIPMTIAIIAAWACDGRDLREVHGEERCARWHGCSKLGDLHVVHRSTICGTCVKRSIFPAEKG